MCFEACLCHAVVLVGVVAQFAESWGTGRSSVVVVVYQVLEVVVQPQQLCECCQWKILHELVSELEVGWCVDEGGVVGVSFWDWEYFVVGLWLLWMKREVVLQLGLCEHEGRWVGCWSNDWLESCEEGGHVVVESS